ncbi:conserved hypothetical protein [Flavobacterium sp. 9AF]|uniref:STAS domain-containing protein n=1 Tax=Flavobacterium sp. 9AF TaxID=2653142 RepID=UPI0012F101A9|nr:STAS domain-containing protein [Flavobacterium sp. 9AF]VXB21493.1 conserved hypothetical protein [Flavobacterium sp. 9AF]
MALQIQDNAGILEINGNLTLENAKSLKNFFEALLMQSSFIIVSLNKVVEMDKSSFDTLIQLYKIALAKNKVFYIVSDKNKKITKLFQTQKLNYMLQNRAA